jgi:pantoate kinase
MISAKAFAPANISCIFRIYRHKSPRWMGSYGIGFTVNEGVAVSVSKSKINEVVFNGNSINFPTVMDVVKKLTDEKIKVHIKTKLPLGCGFGLSGASALATAYALNKLLKLKKSGKELAIVAHTAEVEKRTGLGDVVNQYFGGFCLKLKPSSYFIVRKLSINNTYVYCKYFGPINTKSIITNPKIKSKINDAASIVLKKIKKLINGDIKIDFKNIIKISKEFAMDSGLLKDGQTIEAIKNIEKNKGNASMIMLGNSVFSDRPFKGAIRFKISDKGVCLI